MRCPRRDENPMVDESFPAPDEWRSDGRCSYCGSMSPEEFLRRVELGEPVTPTDKNYKAYLGNGKFYFQHFSEEQCKRLIALVNAKQVKFECPGYFYRLPFFMTSVSKVENPNETH